MYKKSVNRIKVVLSENILINKVLAGKCVKNQLIDSFLYDRSLKSIVISFEYISDFLEIKITKLFNE